MLYYLQVTVEKDWRGSGLYLPATAYFEQGEEREDLESEIGTEEEDCRKPRKGSGRKYSCHENARQKKGNART